MVRGGRGEGEGRRERERENQYSHILVFTNYRVSLSELQSSLDTHIKELEDNLESLREKSPTHDRQKAGLAGGDEGGSLSVAHGQAEAPFLHIPPITVPVSQVTRSTTPTSTHMRLRLYLGTFFSILLISSLVLLFLADSWTGPSPSLS